MKFLMWLDILSAYSNDIRLGLKMSEHIMEKIINPMNTLDML